MKFFGEVVKGESIGRTIGFPTINVSGYAPELDHGVYTCEVSIPGGVYMGVMHYGPKSFSTSKKAVTEIHLLDFDGDVYGEVVAVSVLDKIRDIRHFPSLKELSDQIKKDVKFLEKTNS